MKKISLKLKKNCDHSYQIFIKKEQSKDILQYLKKTQIGKKYAIISDSKVEKLYSLAFARLLRKNGINCEVFSFPHGESSKNLQTVENLAERMLEKGFDRQDAIISYGGGVPGDIAGFLASIYMRGIPFIQIPTTLLAMVDSSVGGKTGVDLESGKNLLGTYYQPKAVFVDIEHLKSLSQKQLRSGLAEVIKYGVIRDAKLFKFIEDNLEKIFKLDEEVLNKIIEQSLKIKAEIVEKDEQESGLRMILNYGHTYGHAIEQMSGYKLLHGYAIAIGMVIINRLAVEQGELEKSEADRIKNLIKAAELPTTTMKKPSKKDLMKDKKKQGDKIKFIIPQKIGKVIIKEMLCP